MTKALVTGINGLVGSAICEALGQVIGFGRGPLRCPGDVDYHEVDLADAVGLTRALERTKPDVVYHAAAMTAVDACETEVALAYASNVDATAAIAHYCRRAGARLVYVSTDYVFDGRSGPYSADSPIRPLGVYAQTKAAGELAVSTLAPGAVIARTAVPFTHATHVRKDFVRWLREQLGASKPVNIVNDQLSNPTYAPDLARMLVSLASSARAGIVHTAGTTQLSRFDFARAICTTFALDPSLVTPVTTASLNQRAPRPLDARLVVDATLGPRSVEDALQRLLARDSG